MTDPAKIRKEAHKEASTGGLSEHVCDGIAKANMTPPAKLPPGFATKGQRLTKAPRRKGKR